MMPALDTARVLAVRTLTDTATLRRAGGLTVDGYGTSTVSWTTTPDVPARIARLGGREALDAARVRPDAVWVVTLPYGTAVTDADELTVNGTTYRVVAVKSGTAALLVRCWVAEVTS